MDKWRGWAAPPGPGTCRPAPTHTPPPPPLRRDPGFLDGLALPRPPSPPPLDEAMERARREREDAAHLAAARARGARIRGEAVGSGAGDHGGAGGAILNADERRRRAALRAAAAERRRAAGGPAPCSAALTPKKPRVIVIDD